MLATLATAVIAFAATNIDDIFLLTFFFGQGLRLPQVVAGQYLGFTALIIVSLIGYLSRFLVPESWIGLLGFVPIFIGAKKLWELTHRKNDNLNVNRSASVFTIAAVTVSNGGDNIGIYAPLFATSDFVALIITLGVFFVLLATWCAGGYVLGRLPIVRKSIDLYGHIIVPFILIGLGIYILLHSGTLTLLHFTRK